ncbi:PIN domain-containing protein [Sandarakinorhabdus sp.]|uniref:PIN domain-containing protein n=1 Tax=Sandarakinorhabdus sp. TaxID=1916663 RepID=UPI00333FE387
MGPASRQRGPRHQGVTPPFSACFDSSILIDFLNEIPAAAELLTSVRLRLISTLTRTEVLTGARSEQEWQDALTLLDGFVTIDVEPAIADAAARLRQQYRLKTPDAIIASTAAAQGVPLLTRDAALAAVPGAVLAYA